MKKIFKYILTSLALLPVSFAAFAQHEEGGVTTSKNVTGPDSNGLYTVTLEAFATGGTTVIDNTKPADIVLVLDVSGSMDENKGAVTQLANGTQISYNTVANSDVEYFYNANNSWYRIYAERSGDTYYLRYRKWNGNGQGNQIGSSNSASGTIVTTSSGYNAVRIATGTSRMTALKKATSDFIDEIEKNDKEKISGGDRPERLHNRIAIVKFASNSTDAIGDDVYTDDGATYNRTQIVRDLTFVENHVDDLKGAVEAFIARGGTQSDLGLAHANTILGRANRDSNKTVVLFTDGEPGGHGFEDGDGYRTAATAINTSSSIKSNYSAKVFTVGTFASAPDDDDNVARYLDAVSSNYTSASAEANYSWGWGGGWSLDISGTLNDDGIDYSKDASGNVDLSSIFKDIASASGGSEAEIGVSTQVQDYVSNSFALPIDTSEMSDDEIQAWVDENVTVYTQAATSETSWGNRVTFAGAQKSLDPDSKQIIVTGFDYSLDDTSTGAGDGNWVGERVPDPLDPSKNFWAGKKLVIEFKIIANEAATGGVGSATNTSDSGVYVLNPETGQLEKVNTFDVPHENLPVNITIKKDGLRRGESATFEIMRIRPKGWNKDGATIEEKMANVEYNIINKPLPYTDDLTVEDKAGKGETGWWTFTKVIVTNTTETDGAVVSKTLLSLDPNYVYVVVEDDWGWAYTTTGATSVQTTSTVEVNPFTFTNQEKDGVLKHAEAVMINHFATSAEGEAETEHYKSSKVEHF